MKTAKILSFALASTTLFLSCKEEEVNPSKEIKKNFRKRISNCRYSYYRSKKLKKIVTTCMLLPFRA